MHTLSTHTDFSHTPLFHSNTHQSQIIIFALQSHSYEYDTLIKPSLASDQDEGGSDL